MQGADDAAPERAGPRPQLESEREWWVRAALVLHSPRLVFTALRDDSNAAAEARQEPVTALVLLAGMASFLLEPTTRTLMDDSDVDGVAVAVIVFLAGGLSGLISYWLGGAAVVAGTRGAGAEGTYRKARHVLAYASVPLALSLLLLWPLRLSVYGGDLFKSGGADSSVGGDLFSLAELAVVAWSLGLLLVGFRVTYGLAWRRVPLALALTALALAALLVVAHAVFGGLGGGG